MEVELPEKGMLEFKLDYALALAMGGRSLYVRYYLPFFVGLSGALHKSEHPTILFVIACPLRRSKFRHGLSSVFKWKGRKT